jgi:hypothetical protein
MKSAVDVFAGFDITVATKLNERGAWIADLSVSRDGKSPFERWPETVQPEWRTPEEAVRDGIERARRVIRHHLAQADSHSWVPQRSRAQSWFNGEMQHRAGITFTR